MLELEASTSSTAPCPAVRGLSLEVGRGELVGLIGPNGAGKSTTLHAIMGVVPAAAGDVRLGGAVDPRPLTGVDRAGRDLARPRRAAASSASCRWRRTSVSGSRPGATNGSEPLAAAYDLFPMLADFRGRQAGALSGGQQQQLAIGRALVAAPDVLLLDEPSLGLAPTMVDTVFAALTEIRDRGVTILLVEQRAQRTVALADRTYVLANGELRMTLTPADADDTEKMIQAYLA